MLAKLCLQRARPTVRPMARPKVLEDPVELKFQAERSTAERRSDMSPMIVATVSGSFHRHMAAIRDAVMEFVDLGVHVLSPSDPRIVDQRGDFLFVASDRV